ncbi:MAG: S46 family peptidase [Leptospiraceae bacterium]|nr:S46 family peptidase [Leptospiraceae bacterium]
MIKLRKLLFMMITGITLNTNILSDEGMWTLDNLPQKNLQEKYDFKITDKWLKNAQLASVRFNDGGSGAFVSNGGLVLTNHHVAMGQLQKMSTKKSDYVKDGFFAKKNSDEKKCPDLELNVLISMENVTSQVVNASKNVETDKAKNEKRKEEIAKIEKTSNDKTRLRSDVVELYDGGEYWLYRYKKYTDVRLVMAPELQAAAFGGDPDNFNYPRFSLDFAFFRVYENNKPIESKNYFKWSKGGAKENELVFVFGHPGSTERQKTMSQILYQKDYSFPEYVKLLKYKLNLFREYANKGKEEKRRAKDYILGMENSLKAIEGELNGLRDKNILNSIEEKETNLKSLVSQNAELKKEFGEIWNRIDSVQKKMIVRHKEFYYRSASNSKLVNIALKIVRYATEIQKPNEKRYEEFRDSNLESLKFRLLSPAPIYLDIEEMMLKNSMELALENLGKEDEFVKLALADEKPNLLAKSLITKTKLQDINLRKELLTGGLEVIQNSKDPLIQWALKIDPILRKDRDWYDDEIESVQTIEGNKLSELKFKAYGKSTYPDATFTLRMSYGTVKGFTDDSTIQIPFKTTYYGLFDRAASFDYAEPFSLSTKTLERKSVINMDTPLNFISTNDITGGNSGSPVINRKGEYVGLIFDGNSFSHVLTYAYTDDKARAVSVHSEGILEALRSIYKMEKLVAEILN